MVEFNCWLGSYYKTHGEQVAVRPGSTIDLPCGSYHVFGSGVGSISLTLNEFAKRIGKPKNGGNNGFVGHYDVSVFMSVGAKATVNAWHHPGGEYCRTIVADLELWRTARRDHLGRLFRVLAEKERRAKVVAEAFAAREAARRALSAAAAARKGRTGGTARRRAARLRREAAVLHRHADSLINWLNGDGR